MKMCDDDDDDDDDDDVNKQIKALYVRGNILHRKFRNCSTCF